IVWGHDWTDILGRYVDYRDTDESLTLVGEFDDFDAVPRARQAYTQLRSGTIDQFSVGFGRREWKGGDDLTPDERAIGAIERMVKADLHEASLVLVGAVPNTELIGVREVRMPNGQTVPEDFVIDLGRKVHAGQITVDEAHTALELVASGSAPTNDTDGPDLDAILAEADEALGL